MKRLCLPIIAAVAFASPSFAQTTTITTTQGATKSAAITVAPEQRTRIKTYVSEHKIKPTIVKERIAVGAVLPADVELHTVPEDWGPSLHTYRYIYSGDDVVLVDPGSRKVIQVID